jgi:hypothetical protein
LPTRRGPSRAINLGDSKISAITKPFASEQKPKIP